MSSKIREFGYSADNAISVAGGILFGAMNERAYLDRLRGPAGQILRYKRIGSVGLPGSDVGGLIDMYEVEHDGLAQSVLLYFDIYSAGPSGIPEGFTLANPQQPWNLPVSTVRAFRSNTEIGKAEPSSKPRKWIIAHMDKTVFGFAEWDGAALRLDLTPNILELIKKDTDHYIELSPVESVSDVLSDYFERALPIRSEGVLFGHPKSDATLPQQRLTESRDQRKSLRRFLWLLIVIVAAGVLALILLR